MNKVTILRGIPGSGKSTYTYNVVNPNRVCSADLFFVDSQTGAYNFDLAKLPAAHAHCLRSFVDALQAGVPNIVVDNTNISVAEVAPYAALALAFGYNLEIVTLDVDPRVGARRNVHGVPAEAVERMAVRLAQESQNFPPWWKHTVVKQ